MSATLQSGALFVFSADERRCALPVTAIAEIMRPLPTDAVLGAPGYVVGAALIRGAPTLVVDLGALLSGRRLELPRRMIALKVNATRRVALLATEVLGLRHDAQLQHGGAPLLENCPSEFIEQLGTLDDALLTVLRSGAIIPPDLWPRPEQP